MAGEIPLIHKAAADARSSPDAAAAARSTSRPKTRENAPNHAAAPHAGSGQKLPEQYPEDRTYLASMLERAQQKALANTTTLSFQQDSLNGKIYIHVKDKQTGEELYRIPRRYLANTDNRSKPGQRLDIHI